MANADVHGPIDVVVMEIPSEQVPEALGQAVADLLESGTVWLYDLMVVSKAADGSVVEVDITAIETPLTPFAGARSGLLGGDDLTDAAEILEPGSMALVLVYENTWAIPFVAAARDAGVELVASSRISAQQIMDVLDELDGSD